MNYILKHCNTPLLIFSAMDGANPKIHIVRINEDAKNLLPLDLRELTDNGLASWIARRTIPKNRAYVANILSSMGLSINRPMDVIKVSKGLSLNDCFWIVEEGFTGKFEKYNLYDNRISRILGLVAFTGYGSNSGAIISSSPEFTTNGMLPKAWRRENGIIRLYKGGTQGASNSGFEPFSEMLAAQIAGTVGVNAIDYSLTRWKGQLCSTCKLFTSKEISYVPIGRLIGEGGMEAIRTFYSDLGTEFTDALNEMIVFDALILNSDRHFGNFGVLVRNSDNKIIAPAPLFDHGNSLMNFAGLDALENKESFFKYADTILPCVYDDFVEEARSVISHEMKNRVRKLVDFKFSKKPGYGFDTKRLGYIEEAVRRQTARILE